MFLTKGPTLLQTLLSRMYICYTIQYLVMRSSGSLHVGVGGGISEKGEYETSKKFACCVFESVSVYTITVGVGELRI